MKIQPIDGFERVASDPLKQPSRSRLKRLFERQFARVPEYNHRDSQDDFEPNSVCLTKMVRNFMEGNSAEKHSVKCSQHHGRSSSCFNGNYIDNSDDDRYDFCRGCADSLNADKSCELLKGLVCCVSSLERNLLADTTKIVEKNSKIFSCKNKTDCRKAVMEGLIVLGYDASICKSKWEETASYPCGEHEYIDVMIEGERVLIDVDFKSEFEIARSTRNYRSILQALPTIFVGKSEPLEHIVSIMSDAAKQSLKKKEMYIPPWRKVEYMKSKWLSPYTTTRIPKTSVQSNFCSVKTNKFSGDFELVLFQEKKSRKCGDSVDQQGKIKVVVTPWEPPAIKPKSAQRGSHTVAGLASIFKDKY